MEKRALKITDIAEMIYLADGVLFAAKMLYMFDENGIQLSVDDAKEHYEQDREYGVNDLIISMLSDEEYDISDAVDTTAAEIIEKLSPIRNRILRLFRCGNIITDSHEFMLYADSSVSDEWLMELFAMRVRDQMIANGLERYNEKTENGGKV